MRTYTKQPNKNTIYIQEQSQTNFNYLLHVQSFVAFEAVKTGLNLIKIIQLKLMQ